MTNIWTRSMRAEKTPVAFGAIALAVAMLFGSVGCKPSDEGRVRSTLDAIRKDLEMDNGAAAYEKVVVVRYSRRPSPLAKDHVIVEYQGDYDLAAVPAELAKDERTDGSKPIHADGAALEKITYLKRQGDRLLLKGQFKGGEKRLAFLDRNGQLRLVCQVNDMERHVSPLEDIPKQPKSSWITRYLTVGDVEVEQWDLDDWLNNGFKPPKK